MLKRVAKWGGIVLAALALAYFALYAWRTLQGHDLSALRHGPGLLGMTLLTSLYTASIAATAFAWLWQLRSLGQPASFRWSATVLAVTQFGKYLPGNVGHHIGRVGLAMNAGVRAPAAVLTIGYELLIAIVAAAHLAAVALLLWPPGPVVGAPWLAHRWPLLALVTIGAAAGVLLAPRLVVLLLRLRGAEESAGYRDRHELSLDARAVIGSYVMYVCGQLAVGVGLWGLAMTLSSSSAEVPSALFFTGAFATSWIAGLIVPGAPAGLGVRELLMTAWLGSSLPPTTAVVIVVAMRVATTIGDALNFLWGSWALTRLRRPNEQRPADGALPP